MFSEWKKRKTVNDMNLGKKLQEHRKAKGITQAEMAKVCGLSKNYISAMERGINNCSAKTLIAYAIKLDMSLDELIGKEKRNDIIPELLKRLHSMSVKEQKKLIQIVDEMMK